MTTRLKVVRCPSAAVLAAIFEVLGRRRSVTMTPPAIVRIIVAVPLMVAVVLGVPSQRVVAGMNSTEAWDTSGPGAASLHPTSNGKIAFLGGFADGSLAVINPDGTGQKQLTLPCPPDPHHAGCLCTLG